MLRTHTCGTLTISDLGTEVTLCGWVQTTRDKGALLWVDLRDRYGITQLFIDTTSADSSILKTARSLGREFVVQATGIVVERSSKNPKMLTGDIEVNLTKLTILNASKVPPFLIEDETDGGDDLRMRYRYLDIRRAPVRNNLQLRHKVAQVTRQYLDSQQFIEVETPVLIKSTPEGARDFIVPSRMNGGQFYALPQSPQTFKQLLMVSGIDRYFQIVKCFRDEDLRADRQPEFTQIDAELSFVTQEDILQTFEGLAKEIFLKVKGITLDTFKRLDYATAMALYGNDKPDLRFEMPFVDLTSLTKGKDFGLFDNAEVVLAINAEGAAGYTRKQLDALSDFLKKPQVNGGALVNVRYNTDGTLKGSADKFFTEADYLTWANACNAKPGDLMLILAGTLDKTRKAMSELRLLMGTDLGLRPKDKYEVLWVLDFPLLEYGEEEKRWFAMHHPFTAPKPEDMHLLDSNPGAVRANAYDLVINGVEVGGGSIRIHDKAVQATMFDKLGFTKQEAVDQFGFLMDAFEYGAPPHGGIAFGFDRLCALLGGQDSIRDFIAFPKNNSGRDIMIDAPSIISNGQLKELSIAVALNK